MWGLCCSSPQNDDTPLTEFSTTDEVVPLHHVLTPRVQKAPAVQVAPVRAPTPRPVKSPVAQAPTLASTLLGHPMNQAAASAGAKVETPCSRKAARSEASCSPAASARGKSEEASPFCGAREHKEQLQDMVTHFVRRAMCGCPCVLLREKSTGEVERVPARYFVDNSLSWLTVEPSEGGPADLARCPMDAVQDIVHVAKDGARCFGPRMTRALAPDEADLLLMIVHTASEDLGSSIHLLLPSRHEVDTFLECLQILSIYAKSQDADS